jgi:hypothetical protein
MELLSEDDLNLKDMTPEELDRAWNLWFDLAQATNDLDPPYTHGVFVLYEQIPLLDAPVRLSSAGVNTNRAPGRGHRQ